jgi:SAM-dependent methyltransferase
MLAGLGAALAGCSTPGIKLDAPYVSTPEPVVKAMLGLAKVKADDMVYDLGCGDGRIVITAAREFGARGVGIDIDPRRLEEATAGARSAGVSERVRFVRQDLFQTDFSEATVMALYLFPEMNERLRPKLQAELRPGARVVAYQFGIKGWTADREEIVWSDGVAHQIYAWVVPSR